MIKSNEELIKLAREGDTIAEEELFTINNKLCFHIARKFTNTNIDIEDLASFARIGLFKAYKKFDFTRGFKFATFASRIMQNEILMHLRSAKKHNNVINLESIISMDEDGGDLTLLEVIPAPESYYGKDDFIIMKDVYNIFCKHAKERDMLILKRCIIGKETQRDIAKEIGTSQSYVARLIMKIEKELKFIQENGYYKPVSTRKIKKI